MRPREERRRPDGLVKRKPASTDRAKKVAAPKAKMSPFGKIKLPLEHPLVVLVPEEIADRLGTIDAGAAYTAHLHATGRYQFKEEPLGKFVHIYSVSISPRARRYRSQKFSYVDLKDVDEVFGSVLRPRSIVGAEIGSTKHRFEAGDILFAKIMPSLANKKFALVTTEITNGVCSTEFLVLRPLAKDEESEQYINPYYLFKALRSDHFTRQAVANVTGATGRQRIAPDVLLSLKIVVPPVPLQMRIASVVEQEFTLRANASELATQADDLMREIIGI